MLAVTDIIDRLYDAVADSGAWASALSGLCEAVDGHHTIVVLRDFGHGSTPFLHAVGVDPAHLARFYDRAAELDPLIHQVPLGVTHHRAALLPDAQASRTDFYNDVIRPMQGFRAMLSVPLRRDGEGGMLAVCRSRQRNDFSDDEVAVVDRVLPHLARVLEARQSLDAAQQRAAAVLGAFDQVAVPIAIVDAELRPLVLNRLAEAVAMRGDGVVVSRHRLAAVGPDENRLLRQLVRRIAAGDARVTGPAAMRLRRPAAAACWLVSAHRLPPDSVRGGREPLVALFLEDANGQWPDLTDRLRVRFDLTVREAAVAAALARGSDLAATAQQLGIALGTARNYLKAIFLKTDTHRQAELVSLLLRVARRH